MVWKYVHPPHFIKPKQTGPCGQWTGGLSLCQHNQVKHDDLTLYNWLHFQINTESCFALSLSLLHIHSLYFVFQTFHFQSLKTHITTRICNYSTLPTRAHSVWNSEQLACNRSPGHSLQAQAVGQRLHSASNKAAPITAQEKLDFSQTGSEVVCF